MNPRREMWWHEHDEGTNGYRERRQRIEQARQDAAYAFCAPEERYLHNMDVTARYTLGGDCIEFDVRYREPEAEEANEAYREAA